MKGSFTCSGCCELRFQPWTEDVATGNVSVVNVVVAASPIGWHEVMSVRTNTGLTESKIAAVE